MARVTVEDCTKIISNRFELVVLASRRAKDLSSGAETEVIKDNDKDAVIALREIAEKKMSSAYLAESVISSYQLNREYVAHEKSAEIKELYETESEASGEQEQGMFAEDNILVED